jgi:hypothetical protein
MKEVLKRERNEDAFVDASDLRLSCNAELGTSHMSLHLHAV